MNLTELIAYLRTQLGQPWPKQVRQQLHDLIPDNVGFRKVGAKPNAATQAALLDEIERHCYEIVRRRLSDPNTAREDTKQALAAWMQGRTDAVDDAEFKIFLGAFNANYQSEDAPDWPGADPGPTDTRLDARRASAAHRVHPARIRTATGRRRN